MKRDRLTRLVKLSLPDSAVRKIEEIHRRVWTRRHFHRLPRSWFRRAHYPSLLTLGLTNKRNLGCFICRREQFKKPEFDPVNLPRFETAIRCAETVNLTALGETLVYPHLKEVLEYIYRVNPSPNLIQIITNVTRLSEETAEMLTGHLGNLTISLNAARRETYNRDMRGGDFDRTLSAIRSCMRGLSKCEKQRVRLHFVAHTENYREIPDFVQFAKSLDISEITGSQYLVSKRKHVRYSLLNVRDEYNQLIESAKTSALTQEITFKARKLFREHPRSPMLCRFPFKMPNVHLDGAVSPCCNSGSFFAGNVFENSFNEVWFGERYLSLRRERFLTACSDCSLFLHFDDSRTHCTAIFKKTTSFAKSGNRSKPVKYPSQMSRDRDRHLDSDSPSGTGRVVHLGVRWTAAGNIIQKALQLATVMVLARFLAPADFGIIATASLFVTVVNLLKKLGMPSALIQRSTRIEESAARLFVLSCTFAIVCYLGMFFLARPLAQFFRTAEIETVVHLMGLTVFIESSSVVQRTLASKFLHFRRIAVVTIVEGCCIAIVSVVVVLFDYRLWAMAYGLLAGPSAGSLIWWLISDWKPRIRFHRGIASELLSFGGSITVSLALQTLIDSVTRTIVGRVIGISSLGLYDLAGRVAYMPVRLMVVSVTQRVALPVFSTIQNDLPRVTNGYRSILKYSSIVLAPLSAFLFLSADLLVPVLCGPQWGEAVPIFRLFSLGVFFLPLVNIRPLLVAIGRIRLLTLLTATRFILTTLIVLFAASHGLTAVCGAEVALLALFTLVNLQAVSTVLRMPVAGFLKILFLPWKSVVLLIFTLTIVRVAGSHMGLQPGWGPLLLMSVPPAAVYIGSIFLFHRPVGNDFLRLLTGELLIKREAEDAGRSIDLQTAAVQTESSTRGGS